MEQEDANAEAAAVAAANAGYARRAGITPAPQPEPPLAEAAPSPAPAAPAPAASDDAPTLEAEPETPAPPPAPEAHVGSQLEDLKAQVRELKAQGVDQATVHRLFGEIGGITRIVNKLQKQTAPTDNELAGAMAAAEKAAKEYPEIGEPMLAALRAVASKLPEKPAEPEEPAAPAPTEAPAPAAPADPFTPDQKAAIKLLDDLHPDRKTLNQSPEFKQWLAAQGRDYEQKLKSTWDFAFITRGYDKFKAAQETRKRKQQQLEAAAAAPGTPAAPAATQPTDVQLARRGYERYAGKRM